PLTDAESLALTAEIARVMAWVHARGVVHRDLKPGNVFLRDARLDRLTIIDFGLAHAGAKPTLTEAGDGLGPPRHPAPQPARGGRVDARSDVFVLGCLLFRFLTGREPFTGGGALAALTKVVLDEPQPLLELRPDLPERLGLLVGRMLEKSQAARPDDDELVPETEANAREIRGAAP